LYFDEFLLIIRINVIWQGEIAPRLHSPAGSSKLQFATECFGWGYDPKSALSLRVRKPMWHNWTPRVRLPNGIWIRRTV